MNLFLNSTARWRNVFRKAAWAILIRHLKNGGTHNPDDLENGMTVKKLRCALAEAFPDERLPADYILYARLRDLDLWIQKVYFEGELAALQTQEGHDAVDIAVAELELVRIELERKENWAGLACLNSKQ